MPRSRESVYRIRPEKIDDGHRRKYPHALRHCRDDIALAHRRARADQSLSWSFLRLLPKGRCDAVPGGADSQIHRAHRVDAEHPAPSVATGESCAAASRRHAPADEISRPRDALSSLLPHHRHSALGLGDGVRIAARFADALFRLVRLAEYRLPRRHAARSEKLAPSRFPRDPRLSRLVRYRAGRPACFGGALSSILPARRRAQAYAAGDPGYGACMKYFAGMIAAMVLFAAAPAQAALWTVDAAHSKLGFSVIWAKQPFSANFKSWKANIDFDPANLTASKADVTIAIGSMT